VLSFTGSPLPADTELAGPAVARVWAASDAPDTDFAAKLMMVDPAGSAYSLVDGIIGASHRRGAGSPPLRPGRAEEFAIHLGSIAVRVPRGWRLRLDVASSNWPWYEANPNTAHAPGTDMLDDYRVAWQSVHTGPEHPSRVQVTILPD
jgi:putative CocE/NonD family hydrolase